MILSDIQDRPRLEFSLDFAAQTLFVLNCNLGELAIERAASAVPTDIRFKRMTAHVVLVP